MRNVLRAEEIYILAGAIEGFVFEVVTEAGQTVSHDGVIKWKGGKIQLQFQGRICFRIDTNAWAVTMVPLSGAQIPAWSPRWYSFGDWLLKKALSRAVRSFSETSFKVQRQDYRALFANEMAQLIIDLDELNTMAEAEAKQLLSMDKTRGGTEYHDEIQRMLQMDQVEETYDGPTADNRAAVADGDEYHELGD